MTYCYTAGKSKRGRQKSETAILSMQEGAGNHQPDRTVKCARGGFDTPCVLESDLEPSSGLGRFREEPGPGSAHSIGPGSPRGGLRLLEAFLQGFFQAIQLISPVGFLAFSDGVFFSSNAAGGRFFLGKSLENGMGFGLDPPTPDIPVIVIVAWKRWTVPFSTSSVRVAMALMK